MKRSCYEMDITDNNMHTESSDPIAPSIKKSKNDATAHHTKVNDLMSMECKEDSDTSEQKLFNMFQKFIASGEHKRDINPLGQALVNPDLVGKKTYQELMDLDTSARQAHKFTMANTTNKVNQMGQQMKHLNENLKKVLVDALRDSQLHMAACNFIKKPGHIYHLYERMSGQKYFSMLSVEDWSGRPPHKFVGSFHLELDESWTPVEEMHSRFEGIEYVRQFLINKSIQ